MKNLFLAFPILLLLLIGVSNAQFTYDASNTLALWHMNEGSGTLINDINSLKNGTLYGGADWSASGKFGSATRYWNTGSGAGMNTAFSFPANSNFTFDFWFNITSLQSSKYLMIMINIPTVKNLQIVTAGNGSIYCYIAPDGSGETKVNSNNTFNYSDGNWHRLTCVRNMSTMSLYIDNVLQSSVASTTNGLTGITSFNLSYNGYDGTWLNSSIDEFRILNISIVPQATDYTNVSQTNYTFVNVTRTSNQSMINGWNINITNGTKTLIINNLSSVASLDFVSYDFPYNEVNITINATNYQGFKSNFTILPTQNNSINISIDRFQYFYVVDDGNILQNNFTLEFYNSTFDINYTTITGSVVNVTMGFPFGDSVNVIVRASGFFEHNFTNMNISSNSEINKTFAVGDSVFIIRATNENDLSALSNVTVLFINSTFTYNTSSFNYTKTVQLSALPVGSVQVSVLYKGGIRNYYVTIKQNTSYVLDAYFPETANYFTFSTKSGENILSGVLISVMKFVNGTYRGVAQGKTQVDGFTTILIEPNFQYRVTASLTGYNTREFDYIFSSSLVNEITTIYLSTLNDTSSIFYSPNFWKLNGLYYNILPNNTFINATNVVRVTLTDSDGYLNWVVVNVTRYQNFSVPYPYYYSNVTGSQSYSWNITLNYSNANYAVDFCMYRNNTEYCLSKTYTWQIRHGIGIYNAPEQEAKGGPSVMFLKLMTFFILAIITASAYTMFGGMAVIILILGTIFAGVFGIFNILETSAIVIVGLISFKFMSGRGG